MNNFHNSTMSAEQPDSMLDSETEAVREFYDRIVSYEWERLDHYILEFAVVRHYLTRFLPPPPARIIDIGGGPGRYTILLAQQGYDVTLFDLSATNIAWAQERAKDACVQINTVVGDVRRLTSYGFTPGQFDIALMMGPLYHLPEAQDRHQAIQEMRSVVRTGGTVFTMMLTRAAAIYEGFNRWPQGILDVEGVRRLMATGAGFNFEQDPHDFEGVYFAHPSEVLPLHAGHQIKSLALAGCEGVLAGRREQFKALAPDLQAGWIQLMLEICEDPMLLAASERILFVGEAV